MLRSSVTSATVADRERIQSALQARLGLAALFAVEGSALSPARLRWPFVASAIVGVGLVGGSLFLTTRHGPERAAPVQHAVVSTVNASAAPVTVPPVESDLASLLPATPAPELSAPSARSAPDRLAQELAFLERATSALHAGRPSNALKVLDEYQRKFPNGLLALERGAARSQALCSLGRRSEALAELSRLPAQSPGVARVKQICDASSKAQR
ncbi:MAG TPA: hypothetical protein VIK01_16330 [Polyangiaceae bacterium]